MFKSSRVDICTHTHTQHLYQQIPFKFPKGNLTPSLTLLNGINTNVPPSKDKTSLLQNLIDLSLSIYIYIYEFIYPDIFCVLWNNLEISTPHLPHTYPPSLSLPSFYKSYLALLYGFLQEPFNIDPYIYTLEVYIIYIFGVLV